MRMDLDQRIPSLMEVREKVNEMEQKVIIKESIADFKQYGLKGATAAILTGDQIKQFHSNKDFSAI